MGGSTLYADRVEGLVQLALGDPTALHVAIRARGDQVLARLAEALTSGRPHEERVQALIETYMHGALQLLADAAGADRFAFGEAEVTAGAVAAAMDRAADALRSGDGDTVAAAMTAAEALLDVDLAGLYERLL